MKILDEYVNYINADGEQCMYNLWTKTFTVMDENCDTTTYLIESKEDIKDLYLEYMERFFIADAKMSGELMLFFKACITDYDKEDKDNENK